MNDKRPSGEVASESSPYTSDQISVYIVREGDTLSGIANMFDVTENTIRWANDINGKTVRIGQQLIILPISGVKYVVKKNDTIKSIAKSFNGDEGEILSYNNLRSASELKVGEEIIIPKGEITTVTTTTKVGSVKSTTSGSTAKTKTSSGLKRPVNGGKKSQGLHGHNGVDIAAPLNTPIMAAAAGKVIIAKGSGWNGGYGEYVVISHSNGTQTLYAHMNSVAVSAGETVSQGQVIGYMGTTGQSTGIHLHFEVRGGTNPF